VFQVSTTALEEELPADVEELSVDCEADDENDWLELELLLEELLAGDVLNVTELSVA
jgi:hypothetical protein